MLKKFSYKILDKVELTAGLLSVFFIPIQKQVVVILILIWLLAALSNFILSLSNGYKINFFKKEFLAFAVLACFYLMHVIGMLYSSNLKYGFFDLEVKMTLIVIPLLIYIRSEFYADKLISFLKALSLGLLISLIINLITAYLIFSEDGNKLNFYYSRLSTGIHPSYMALYTSIAMLGLIHYWKKIKILANEKISFFLKLIVFVILLIYLFLLSSKAGIISFSFAIFVFATFQLLKKLKLIVVIPISIFLLVLPILIVSLIPTVSNRFKEVSVVFKNPENSNIDSDSGSLVRIAIIKAGWELSIENMPWGVGTGDIKDAIIEHHQNKGSVSISSRYFNAHNQFAQTTIALGVFGLLFLLLFFVFGFAHAYKQKKILLSIFLMILLINFMFESMFETQAGVIFIVLFYSLLLAEKNEKKQQAIDL